MILSVTSFFSVHILLKTLVNEHDQLYYRITINIKTITNKNRVQKYIAYIHRKKHQKSPYYPINSDRMTQYSFHWSIVVHAFSITMVLNYIQHVATLSTELSDFVPVLLSHSTDYFVYYMFVFGANLPFIDI